MSSTRRAVAVRSPQPINAMERAVSFMVFKRRGVPAMRSCEKVFAM